MKNTGILFFLILFGFHVNSQSISLELATPQPEIFEVYSGSIVHGDFDNDGDLDLIQSGIGENGTGQSVQLTVFLNDGQGNFTELAQNFNDFWNTETAYVADLDGDNDLDLIVAAYNTTELYKNDGQGNFIFENNTPFQPSSAGDISIGDVDGDGDNDVIQHGSLDLSNPFTALYLNDGNGNFTEVTDAGFQPYANAGSEFIDLENDGDLDFIVFGNDVTDVNEVKFYENDGSGNFTSIDTGNVIAHSTEDIDVGDIDNDGDMDFLVSGISVDSESKTSLYLNDGNGNFTALANTPFPDVFANSNNIADLDNDGDLDVLIVGSAGGGIPNIFAIVFENLGNNNFIAADSLSGEYIPANTIADFNGDGKKDIIIQGFVDDTNVYWNQTVISNVEELSTEEFSVFPNPSKGEFQIAWLDAQIKQIEIIDQQGKLVYSEVPNQQGTQQINLNAAPGLYVLRLHSGNQIGNQKIVLTQ